MVILETNPPWNHSESARNGFLVEFSFDIGLHEKISTTKTWIFLIFSKILPSWSWVGIFDLKIQIFFKLRNAESSRAETLHTSSTYKYYLCEKYQLENSSQSKDMKFFVFENQNFHGSLLNRFFLKKIEKFMFFCSKILAHDIYRKKIRRETDFWHF